MCIWAAKYFEACLCKGVYLYPTCLNNQSSGSLSVHVCQPQSVEQPIAVKPFCTNGCTGQPNTHMPVCTRELLHPTSLSNQLSEASLTCLFLLGLWSSRLAGSLSVPSCLYTYRQCQAEQASIECEEDEVLAVFLVLTEKRNPDPFSTASKPVFVE